MERALSPPSNALVLRPVITCTSPAKPYTLGTPSPPPGGEGELRLNGVHPYFPCLTARSDRDYDLIFKGDKPYTLGTPSPAGGSKGRGG